MFPANKEFRNRLAAAEDKMLVTVQKSSLQEIEQLKNYAGKL